MEKIKVLLADDHSILREGLRLLLEGQKDIEVIGEAGDGAETMELARRLRPEVILMDIGMPRMNGLEALALIREVSPESSVVILSCYEKEAYVHQALNSGAKGYVVKGSPSREVLDAIRAARDNKFYLGSQIQGEVIHAYLRGHDEQSSISGFNDLSDREKQVFHLIVEGNTTSQIADILCISSKTVDKHRASIARKIGIDNPVKMVQYAIRTGLVDPAIWEE